MKTWHWLTALILAGVLVRLGVLSGYEPLAYPDSATYITAARDLVSGDYTLGQGRRTPGYPLFIALIGETPQRLMLTHMAVGMVISVLLFQITLLMTGKPGLAFGIGMAYHLNLQQLFLEAALLTETLTTLMVAATLAALLPALHRLRCGRSGIGLLLLAGMCAAAAIMVRPQFLVLPVVLPLAVIYAVSALRWPSPRALGHAALVVLPSVLAVLGWATVLQSKMGTFTMSTQSGFGLVNHSVEFIELAPEPYAAVRDILLKHRAERIAAAGHAGNTIWYALPEIRQATGWTLPEASRQMQKMSTQMFAAHPWLYAQSVARPWVEFWTVPIMWAPERVTPDWLSHSLQGLWWVEHKLLRLSNLLFVLLAAGVLLSGRLREAVRWDLNATTISAVILASSLMQALADRGAGSRYAVTTQALVLLVVVVSAYRWRSSAPRLRSTTAVLQR